ncbi:MAG: DUF3108 domain-containing protein [Alistipes sp.]
MKRLLLIGLISFFAVLPAAAQLFHPGEVLDYRVSYKAKLFPNTEVGAVQVATTQEQYKGASVYRVEAHGRTLPTYRWFFDLDDRYSVLTDVQTLRPVHFEGSIKEGSYTFWSFYEYDWESRIASTRWQSRKKPVQTLQIPLTNESLDAISLFFRMRSADPKSFRPGEVKTMQMVLQDTVRQIKYRFEGREQKKIRNMGKYNTLRFSCQLGTSENFSFTDGTEFLIWISDDQNKIPLYMESPVKVGSIQAYISGYKGLKYPVSSLIK